MNFFQGLWDFVKSLWSADAPRGRGGDPDGMYFYIQSDRTGEVIQVRLHRGNDLSYNDDFSGFYARKVLVGEKSFDRIEAEFSFDKGRRLINADIQGGVLADRATYESYLASRAQQS